MIIAKEFTFDSSHQLPDKEIYGKCRFLHGHTYKLIVKIDGPVNEEGWVMDFKALKEIVNSKVINRLDHNHLNKLIPLPTAENILLWIREQLIEINSLMDIELHSLILWETPTSYAEMKL